MELIRGLHNLRARHRGAVATIGNFDGVHRGHQAMLAQLAMRAREIGAPTTLITFEPHPLEFLRPDVAPPRLSRLRDKTAALQRFGLDRMLCLPFDQRLANTEPEQFIQRILLDGLQVRYLLVGDDFRFGCRRRGDYAMLARAGEEHGIQVEQMPTVADAGERISSTRVREALARHDLQLAAELLGRPYTICGRVRRGDALGRTLGFPTVNLGLSGKRPPLTGIFAVRVHGLEEVRQGVASLGTRPTVNGRETLLETYLLDFAGDLYGRHIEVEFLRHLRDEERFDSLEALTAQMTRDIEQARALFASGEI